MNRNFFTNVFALISLSTSVACQGAFQGDDISGTWEGEFEAEGESLDLEFTLEHDGDNKYSGTGESEWYCVFGSGDYAYWDECTLNFDIEAETEDIGGEQEISFELDDCWVEGNGDSADADCPSDFELDWDGENAMEGELDDDVDVEIERD